MRVLQVLLPLAAFLGQAAAAPKHQAKKPPYFILTGDSTVAVNGGWGDGFLRYVAEPAAGVNAGKSGATTVSYRASGLWDTAIAGVEEHVEDYEPIVTIQFGHNDQKVMTTQEYQSNLTTLIADVKAAGGTPIIITSLTRRTFSGGSVVQNLEAWRVAAIATADEADIQWLDLNIASTNYINAIGSANADEYNLSSGDRTHLNTAGETVFGRMVADLLLEKRCDLEPYIIPNEALSAKIWAGEFATGDE
ncbi:SGNH hydrolase-type esterase domain-containing protein [Dactylonectria macrodidyma]|uniref:SGNH hydrolase-type esterase domain-containing protein n=1 Tax=Dactylonectria macrodidyma TaxID=307937 RepID=A0A9P9J8M9_9HYPO|nr:SGNH hydrolase-type esterase domain-containing protein [Dactylonectria macrodidyma]